MGTTKEVVLNNEVSPRTVAYLLRLLGSLHLVLIAASTLAAPTYTLDPKGLDYKGFRITLADEYRTIEMNKRLTCPAKDGALLWATDWFDKYVIDITTNASGRILVFREADVRPSNHNSNPATPIQTWQFGGVGPQRLVIDTRALNTDAFALLDCQSSNGSADVRITRLGQRGTIDAKGHGYVAFMIMIDSIDPLYKWPPLTLRIQPCGAANAYSSPNIIICSELVGDLLNKNMIGALAPILLHELGHSVLKGWGLPGYDNEDMVDEFATFILSSTPNGRSDLNTYIQWLDAQDSVSEAVNQIYVGDKHTISLQRARNIRNALEHSEDIKARWHRLLKPYEK